MSSAFVREGESENLRDVAPNLTALLTYLRREGGQAVRELKREYHERYKREVYDLSDGLSYMINDDHQWQIILNQQGKEKPKSDRP